MMAKKLGMSAVTLNKRLHELGIIYNSGGYTGTKTQTYNDSLGYERTNVQTY
jgi:anti-repressor protein